MFRLLLLLLLLLLIKIGFYYTSSSYSVLHYQCIQYIKQYLYTIAIQVTLSLTDINCTVTIIPVNIIGYGPSATVNGTVKYYKSIHYH